MTEEHAAYHALCLKTQSNYRLLGHLRKQHTTWQEANGAYKNEKEGLNPSSPLPDDIRLILRDEPGYPSLLREIPWSPFGIYVQGMLSLPTVPLAIVGTRNATDQGVIAAREFSKTLAEKGCVIISGLALGIDAAAHKGCLEAGGTTIAVLANGLDRIYPTMHSPLAQKILESGGALVSEYPPGTPPLPYRFLERNRIVSGLSRGVLVIEAPQGSGSKATARFATEQNREVFVLPGHFRHPNFRASHELIRNGAELVTDPEQILLSLGVEFSSEAKKHPFHESPEERIVYETLTTSGTTLTVDKLIELTTLNPQTVTQTLTYLMMKGMITEEGTGYVVT